MPTQSFIAASPPDTAPLRDVTFRQFRQPVDETGVEIATEIPAAHSQHPFSLREETPLALVSHRRSLAEQQPRRLRRSSLLERVRRPSRATRRGPPQRETLTFLTCGGGPRLRCASPHSCGRLRLHVFDPPTVPPCGALTGRRSRLARLAFGYGCARCLRV